MSYIQQPTAEQCLLLLALHPNSPGCTSPNSRTFAHHSHPHHLNDANTSNSSLPPSFHLVRPKLDRRGRPNIFLEEHSAQAIHVNVFQHTTDRMRLWDFVGHLTAFCHVVKLLYQHCVRDQVHVRTASKESTVHGHSGNDDSISKCLWESSVLHWPRLATCVLSFSCFSLSVGRTSFAFRSHSPLLFDFNLTSVHLSRFDLTLVHSAWDKCTTACRKGLHILLPDSTALRNYPSTEY